MGFCQVSLRSVSLFRAFSRFPEGVEKCNERDGSSVTFAPVTPQPLLCGSTADPAIKAGATLSFLFFSLYTKVSGLISFFFSPVASRLSAHHPAEVQLKYYSDRCNLFFLWRCLMLVLLPTLRWFFGSEYKCELLPCSVISQPVVSLIFYFVPYYN